MSYNTIFYSFFMAKCRINLYDICHTLELVRPEARMQYLAMASPISRPCQNRRLSAASNVAKSLLLLSILLENEAAAANFVGKWGHRRQFCRKMRPPPPRFNSVAKFSPTKLNQTEFLTNQGINSYLITEGALDFSPTKRNLLLILEISRQPVGEKCHTI